MNALLNLLPDSLRQSYLSVFSSPENERGFLLLQVLVDLNAKQWYQQLSVQQTNLEEESIAFILAFGLNKEAKAEARKREKVQTGAKEVTTSETSSKPADQKLEAIFPLSSNQNLSLFRLDQLRAIGQRTLKEKINSFMHTEQQEKNEAEGTKNQQNSDAIGIGRILLCIIDSDSTSVYYQLSSWTPEK